VGCYCEFGNCCEAGQTWPAGRGVEVTWLRGTGGLPRATPPPEDLPNPGIEPKPSAFQVDSLPSEPPGKQIQLSNPVLLAIITMLYIRPPKLFKLVLFFITNLVQFF